MSQNISIKEGDLARQFGHINKLKVPQSGGGDTLWVPEDEVQTDTLYVDTNGTYDAHTGIFTETITKTKKTKSGKKKKVTTYVQHYDEDLLCYGWDEVHVNIVDSVTGIGSDGNLHNISVGDNDMLQDEKIPSYIKIITPPDRTSYIMGEVIDTKGMVVKAYYEDDTEYGEIPRSDYTIDPIVALYGDEKYSDGDGVNARKVTLRKTKITSGTVGHPPVDGYITSESFGEEESQPIFLGGTHGTQETEWLVTRWADNDKVYVMMLSGDANHNDLYVPETRTGELYGAYRHSGGSSNRFELGAFVPSSWQKYITAEFPISTKDPTRAGEMHSTGNKVTVLWDRGDGVELTDTFDITVHDPPIPVIDTGSDESDDDTPVTPPSHGEMQ